MTVKIKDLALELGLSSDALKAKLAEFGFDVKKGARTVDTDVALLVKEEIAGGDSDSAVMADTASEYADLLDEQLDREIIKSQRKKTAGKDEKKKQKVESGEQIPSVSGVIEIPEAISVKEFGEKTGLNPAKIIGELMRNGILANINQTIDFDTAQIVAEDLGIQIKKRRSAAALEDVMAGNLAALLSEDDPNDLLPRPPIISVIGHIDHGKTSLLDSIRETNVTASEAGGITQHIGAYQVVKNGKKITFLDTPGHEAFTAMRARGAKATDIAILVVASDEGVKPQTVEAINHAREADIPIVVAITKIDKPGAQVDKVKSELTEYDLQPEDWGGKTVMVGVSAKTGEGMEKLLDMILLVAEMEDLKANPNRPAVGSVIEAHLDPSLGPTATVLINTGSMNVMDNVAIGETYGRIKVMTDHTGKKLKKVEPSDAVQIAGLQTTPHAGDILQVMADERSAKQQALAVMASRKAKEMRTHGALEQIVAAIQQGKLKTLKIVLKADTKGSLEAIKQSLAKVKHDDVGLKIIHSGVGDISESDVLMVAGSSGGVIVGFHVAANPQAQRAAHKEGVSIKLYKIIYELLDDMKNILSGMLEPETVVIELGTMKVKQVFLHGRKEMIVGCAVTHGKAQNKLKFRIIRDGGKVGEGQIVSLHKGTEQIKELNEGNDCGVKMTFDIPPQEDDIFEIYKVEKRERTL